MTAASIISTIPTDPTPAKINLLGLDRAGMQDLLTSLGEKPFRADQLLKWVHANRVDDFSTMSNLSKALREKLQQTACIELPEIIWEKVARDGTHKWLLRLAGGGSAVEMVFIPEKRRGTLCISSQVGCALDCSFCSTGKQGFSRNLSMAEIIGQLQLAQRRLARYQPEHPESAALLAEQNWPYPYEMIITNVVFMGMGEPLLNFDNVVPAMNLMMDDMAYGLSKYRVTLSTSGVVPTMLRLKKASEAALAVSLHAPNDALRNKLVPINKKYPLEQLMEVCRDYFKGHNKRVVTFEYVMLKDINDTPQHAKELIKLLHNVPCKLNLIPFNPFPLTDYECSTPEAIATFQSMVQKSGIHTTVRKTRGDDIDAACGQLVGKFQDRTTRNVRWLKKQTGNATE